LAVAESGTISGAAAALHASDSAVADALTSLERALGTRLLQRRRARGVTLTSDGLAVLPLARRLLMAAEEVIAVVGQGSMSLTGLVRLGATTTLAPVVLALLIAELGRSHPGLRLELNVDDQPVLVKNLADGNLDLLISYDLDVPPELGRQALYSTAACVVLSAEHPLASRRQIRLSEIADEPMVLLDIAASRVHTLEIMSSTGVTPRIAYRTDNYELCRSLVGRGLGYTLLMWRHVSSDTWDGGKVVFLPIHPTSRDVDVLALWRTEHVSARVAVVLDTLRSLAVAFAGETRLAR
jgi:DNA-binding transcriptional LysR family regulator